MISNIKNSIRMYRQPLVMERVLQLKRLHIIPTISQGYNPLKNFVESKLLEVNHILDDEALLTEPEKVELLRDHRAWLESQKTFASKKSGIVAQIVSTLQPTSLVFDDFLDLEQKFNTIEMQIITAVDKIKEKVAQFQKDK